MHTPHLTHRSATLLDQGASHNSAAPFSAEDLSVGAAGAQFERIFAADWAYSRLEESVNVQVVGDSAPEAGEHAGEPIENTAEDSSSASTGQGRDMEAFFSAPSQFSQHPSSAFFLMSPNVESDRISTFEFKRFSAQAINQLNSDDSPLLSETPPAPAGAEATLGKVHLGLARHGAAEAQAGAPQAQLLAGSEAPGLAEFSGTWAVSDNFSRQIGLRTLWDTPTPVPEASTGASHVHGDLAAVPQHKVEGETFDRWSITAGDAAALDHAGSMHEADRDIVGEADRGTQDSSGLDRLGAFVEPTTGSARPRPDLSEAVQISSSAGERGMNQFFRENMDAEIYAPVSEAAGSREKEYPADILKGVMPVGPSAEKSLNGRIEGDTLRDGGAPVELNMETGEAKMRTDVPDDSCLTDAALAGETYGTTAPKAAAWPGEHLAKIMQAPLVSNVMEAFNLDIEGVVGRETLMMTKDGSVASADSALKTIAGPSITIELEKLSSTEEVHFRSDLQNVQGNNLSTARGITNAPSSSYPVISQQIMIAASGVAEGGSIELALSPEELGRIRMTLSPADNSIHVTIQADRPETLELMRRNADELLKDFRALGYADVNMSFGEKRHPGGAQTSSHDADALVAPPPAPRFAAAAPATGHANTQGLDLRF